MKYDERYEGFEELKTETSDEGVKLNFEIKRLVTNIEVLDGMIILSILNAFPELSKKHSFTVAKGWKVIGIDAVIVIEGRPRWQHSQN